MHLRGQHGYAMVALLVGMAIAAILMTAVMPSWSQAARREKEEELIFRGQQYARAIGLFQRKAGPGVLPPNVDVLVSQRFLRKKYKDPITGKDFSLLSAVTPPAAPGRGVPPTPGTTTTPAGRGGVAGAGGVAGGVMGVASTSTAESLKIYNGRTHYNEWQFVYVARTQAPGETTGTPPNRGGGPGGPPGRAGGPGGPAGRDGRGGAGGGPGGNPSPFGPRSGMPGGPPQR